MICTTTLILSARDNPGSIAVCEMSYSAGVRTWVRHFDNCPYPLRLHLATTGAESRPTSPFVI